MPAAPDLVASVSPNVSGPAALLAVEATVRKLSNTGLSLSLLREDAEQLGGADELRVELSLPGRPGTHAVACLVRHRAEYEGAVLLSCEYDWSATMDPLAVVEDLLEYVLESP
ncbi:MAG: hypothetical protein RLW62_23035 [Gammaproteobacteria bacterium]